MTIDLLGIGVAQPGGTPLLRRVCVRLERRGELVAVVARRRSERQAFLEVVSGRRIPDEGRVWVNGIPLMRQTAGRIRGVIADAGPDARLAAQRSLFWNTLVTPHAVLEGLWRMPRAAERAAAMRALTAVQLRDRAHDRVAGLSAPERARVVLARALARRTPALVLSDAASALGIDGAIELLGLVRAIARTEQLTVLASTHSVVVARACADRILVLADGLLVFAGSATEFTEDLATRHLVDRLAGWATSTG
jgi:iron complex transport system ATP-binding protein